MVRFQAIYPIISLLALTLPLGIATSTQKTAHAQNNKRHFGPSYTQLSFCHRTSLAPKLYVAYTYRDRDSGWKTEGWKKVWSGECKDVFLNNYEPGDVYIYAQSQLNSDSSLKWEGSNVSICVNVKEDNSYFQKANAHRDSCNDAYEKKVRMHRWQVRPGFNGINFIN